MKKTLIVIALLALIVPGVLLAQEDLTLEGLAETVQGMNADFGLFARELAKVNARVDALENQLAAAEAEPAPAKSAGTATGAPCIVIAGSGSMMTLGSQLRPETLDAYLNKFGSSLEDVVVKYARFHPQDGILEVRYKPMMDFGSSLEIVERWRGCKFLGVEFERG